MFPFIRARSGRCRRHFYSERQLYEAALDRLSREISAVQKVTETEAIQEIEAALAKGPRRGPKPADEPEAVAEEEAA